jgi:hypothetical protein
MLDSVTKMTNRDAYRQMVQLAASIIDKSFDTNSGIKKKMATLLLVIGSSLLNWFETLKSIFYSGRYFNEVRVSLQAVTVAITSKAPPGMLSSIARLTGATRFQLASTSDK